MSTISVATLVAIMSFAMVAPTLPAPMIVTLFPIAFFSF